MLSSTGEVNVERLFRLLGEDRVALVVVATFQPGSTLGPVAEFEDSLRLVVVADVEGSNTALSRADVENDLDERVGPLTLPLPALAVEREECYGVLRVELLVARLVAVVEANCLNREMKAEVDDPVSLEVLELRSSVLLSGGDRRRSVLLVEEPIGVSPDVPPREVVGGLNILLVGVLRKVLEIAPVGASGLALPLRALSADVEVYSLPNRESGRIVAHDCSPPRQSGQRPPSTGWTRP